jgi:hypothetical protein
METEIYEFINQISANYPVIASRALRVFELDINHGSYKALKYIQDNLSDYDVKNQIFSQELINKLSLR